MRLLVGVVAVALAFGAWRLVDSKMHEPPADALPVRLTIGSSGSIRSTMGTAGLLA